MVINTFIYVTGIQVEPLYLVASFNEWDGGYTAQLPSGLRRVSNKYWNSYKKSYDW